MRAVVVGLAVRSVETSGSMISHRKPNAAAGTARETRSRTTSRLRRRLVDFRMRDPYDMDQVSRENSEGRVYQKLRRLRTISQRVVPRNCRRRPLERGQIFVDQFAAPAQRARQG